VGKICRADAVSFGLVVLIRPISAELGGCLVLDNFVTRRVLLHQRRRERPTRRQTDDHQNHDLLAHNRRKRKLGRHALRGFAHGADAASVPAPPTQRGAQVPRGSQQLTTWRRVPGKGAPPHTKGENSEHCNRPHLRRGTLLYLLRTRVPTEGRDLGRQHLPQV